MFTTQGLENNPLKSIYMCVYVCVYIYIYIYIYIGYAFICIKHLWKETQETGAPQFPAPQAGKPGGRRVRGGLHYVPFWIF